MQSLLQGLPLETQEFTYTQPTIFQQLAAGDAGDVMTLISDIFGGKNESRLRDRQQKTSSKRIKFSTVGG